MKTQKGGKKSRRFNVEGVGAFSSKQQLLRKRELA